MKRLAGEQKRWGALTVDGNRGSCEPQVNGLSEGVEVAKYHVLRTQLGKTKLT